MSVSILLVVPGTPVGKGRPKFDTRGRRPRAYTPDETSDYERLVRNEWLHVTRDPERPFSQREPWAGPVSLTITAAFPVPVSWPRWQRQAALAGVWPMVVKPDGDNVDKIVGDALNGHAWRDDCQVVEHTTRKLYAADPCLTVDIRFHPAVTRETFDEWIRAHRTDA